MNSKIKATEPCHTYLSLQVLDFSLHINAGISHKAIEHGFSASDTPIYSFKSDIEIIGKCMCPEERADCFYTVHIHGENLKSKDLDITLQEFQVKNKDGSPKYKKRKDGYFPIYDPPKSIGFVEKVRGKNRWNAYAFVAPETVTDMLTILTNVRPLFVFIHEVKEARNRRLRSISLQTSDPSLE